MTEKTFSPEVASRIRRSFSSPVEESFYRSLASMPRDAAELQALQVLMRELRRAETGLRAAIIERYHAWAELTPLEGIEVANAFDAAMDHLTPEQQDEMYAAEREVVLNGLSYRQFETLAEFVPWLRSWYVPRAEASERTGLEKPYVAALALAG